MEYQLLKDNGDGWQRGSAPERYVGTTCSLAWGRDSGIEIEGGVDSSERKQRCAAGPTPSAPKLYTILHR
jgi:hypothetical protein